MRILCTNDDGIHAPGVHAAWRALNAAGHEVFVCVPDRPRSAQPPRFYVNARAIIERQTEQGTEVLLQRREKPGQPRRLEFPGGQLDPFEGILEALRREVREETGLTVTALLDPANELVNDSPGGKPCRQCGETGNRPS